MSPTTTTPRSGRRRLVLGGAALTVTLALTVGACGGATGSDADAASSPDASEDTGTGAGTAESTSSTTDDVWSADAVHAISVEFDQAAYDAMIETYVDSGDKEWITATVTIDGTTYTDVGLRLKGNSSLAGLGGTGRGASSASADEPESLPWLIRLDKYVDGQNDRGTTELVVRGNNTDTSLNEAVALELLTEAGLSSQRSTYARYSVNGSAEELRLVVENPGDEWADANLSEDGVLYKAETGGDYSYRGDDPEAYVEVFDQETDEDEENLAPLIEFLDFIDNSDDATFAAELDQHLDVEAFASYLAVEELLANFDDIDGPGNNSYLWYDEESGTMTVVPWDHNLAFGAMGAMGGGAGGGGQMPQMPEGFEPPADGELPEGMAPPEGMEMPEGMDPPEGMGGGRGGFGAMGGGNILVERFHEVEEFEALYEQALTDLQASLYDSGVAVDILETKAALLLEQAGDLVDEATVDSESQTILDVIST